MPRKDGAQEKPDEKCGGSADEVGREGQDGWRDQPIPIEPNELGILGEIFDATVVGILVFRDEQPTDVRIPETFAGIVGIAVLVGQTMVDAMMRTPPKGAFLCAGLSQKCQEELKSAARLVRAVREISMISPRDREHANPIERCAEGPVLPTGARPEGKQRYEVHNDKRHRAEFMIISQWFFRVGRRGCGHGARGNFCRSRTHAGMLTR